ncbi:uncharacterized protein BO96DRAFT_470709 [Aspergillus niger CBS 101883]|uniref:uncharacterized protein n=1 Tax=Aspergillus lacticoffeatus (strain CBS 101883) TaxID=1450533 RepID=UPI000D7FBA4C|nr:uncharacterized protein BO96DRAFT_470709 [Aspergillus niger CBS 101883]PYH50546.1 hypothetical protein BO96DRAFT_470709 [Aspergillus niger CBS 101883]
MQIRLPVSGVSLLKVKGASGYRTSMQANWIRQAHGLQADCRRSCFLEPEFRVESNPGPRDCPDRPLLPPPLAGATMGMRSHPEHRSGVGTKRENNHETIKPSTATPESVGCLACQRLTYVGGRWEQEKEGPVASWSTLVCLSPALVSQPDRSMENRACAILWGRTNEKVQAGILPIVSVRSVAAGGTPEVIPPAVKEEADELLAGETETREKSMVPSRYLVVLTNCWEVKVAGTVQLPRARMTARYPSHPASTTEQRCA